VDLGGQVSYLIDVPVEGGGRLLVGAAGWQLAGEPELAARPGEIVTRARESLERSLDQLKPALSAVAQRLRAMSPDEFSVELGLTLGAESGLVVAKGSGEVHFTVTFSPGGTLLATA
jgi:NTP-dependent ternary system trypsin peptidase co-occuring protein